MLALWGATTIAGAGAGLGVGELIDQGAAKFNHARYVSAADTTAYCADAIRNAILADRDGKGLAIDLGVLTLEEKERCEIQTPVDTSSALRGIIDTNGVFPLDEDWQETLAQSEQKLQDAAAAAERAHTGRTLFGALGAGINLFVYPVAEQKFSFDRKKAEPSEE
jgi:hypothetical protein